MCVNCFHIVSLFLSNPCTPSTLSKEAFVYFVCPTEIPQPPFAWKYYESLNGAQSLGLKPLHLLCASFSTLKPENHRG